MNILKTCFLSSILIVSANATAGIINGGDLLDQSGANLLEGYLGLGDQDFTNIADLTVGDSSSYWHSQVDSYTDVISIYDVTYKGQNYLIGGYSSIGHASNGYNYDSNASIFNLSLNIVAYEDSIKHEQYAVYNSNNYFATFGGGHDLYGGNSTLGNYGYNWDYANTGSYGYSYIQAAGGLFGAAGVDGTNNVFSVNGLESYVFSDAVDVPEPSVLAMFALGLAGIGFARRRKQQA